MIDYNDFGSVPKSHTHTHIHITVLSTEVLFALSDDHPRQQFAGKIFVAQCHWLLGTLHLARKLAAK